MVHSRNQALHRLNITGASHCEVAVVGAGPYGLSISAHLLAAGIETSVFGEPLEYWRSNMPDGMVLRSPWCTSHLADPHRLLTLDKYAVVTGYEPVGKVPIARFVDYGDWFQREAVPHVDRRRVARLEQSGSMFRLVLTDGESVRAHRVVVATGLMNQQFVPAEFAGVPTSLATHSSAHNSLREFRGQRVAVVGRGQSAIEDAVLLSEAGAEVEVISRGPVRWIGSEANGSAKAGPLHRLMDRMSAPSRVGPFPFNRLADKPAFLRVFPDRLRSLLSQRCLRPAAGGWLKERAAAIRFNPGRRIVAVQPKESGLIIQLDNGCSALVDHALLATGFTVDIGRIGILPEKLLPNIEQLNGSPVLSRTLESSIPGLFFAGCYAVHSLGPLMRFIWGAGYAARAIVSQASVASASKANHVPKHSH